MKLYHAFALRFSYGGAALMWDVGLFHSEEEALGKMYKRALEEWGQPTDASSWQVKVNALGDDLVRTAYAGLCFTTDPTEKIT